MRAVVVYESMFGNTEQIAHAVAEGLATTMDVTTVEVGTVEVGTVGTATVGVGTAAQRPGDDIDLLVAGGPTHAFGLSRAATRQSAAEQEGGPIVSGNGGIREWLAGLPQASGRNLAATFDTHIDKRWFPGSAARGAARRLRRRGYRLALAPESFYVTGTPGPLLPGELARARDWGARLGATVSSAAA